MRIPIEVVDIPGAVLGIRVYTSKLVAEDEILCVTNSHIECGEDGPELVIEGDILKVRVKDAGSMVR